MPATRAKRKSNASVASAKIKKSRETRSAGKKTAGLRPVEEAMRGLPLREDAESHIPALLHVFETTFYAVKRQLKNTPATRGEVDEQLNKLISLSDNLADHIKGMNRDALAIWGRAGGVASSNDAVVDASTLFMILTTTSEWAERGLEATERALKGKRGPDAMAIAMRDAAAFVYTKLTRRRAGRVYDAHAGTEKDSLFTGFLAAVYAAYGIKASARSRARRR